MGKYQIHQSDQNEAIIVQALEACGWAVYKIGRPVDLLIHKHGITQIAEVKMPKAKLRKSQEAFIKAWPGKVLILRSVEDVRALART